VDRSIDALQFIHISEVKAEHGAGSSFILALVKHKELHRKKLQQDKPNIREDPSRSSCINYFGGEMLMLMQTNSVSK